jgi:histidinol dehydrogenase
VKTIDWQSLSEVERETVLARPGTSQDDQRRQQVSAIIDRVRSEGDAALRAFSAEFDKLEIDTFGVPEPALGEAWSLLEPELAAAIDTAIDNLTRFHRACAPQTVLIETSSGVLCERVLRPIDRVGLYVPAGSAPLPSTLLMLGMPAVMAGCRDIVLCCPPGADGQIDQVILAAAFRVGIRQIYRVGGAQAIAAMAYGTESVPGCNKLFGPGNSWVTEAKLQVSTDAGGAAIDMPAGPSEVLVVADASADPEFIAADLLSQAEHGPDSQVLLVSDSERLLTAVAGAIDKQLSTLERAEIAQASLRHARLIQVATLADAIELSNRYAPEHLIINTVRPRSWLDAIRSAGSVFLGPWAPESIGDYCSGTNHVLPTNGWARAYSGLSVADFVTSISVQELSRDGLMRLGPTARILARCEGLTAHEQAVAVRMRRARAEMAS